MFGALANEAKRLSCRRMDWTALDWNKPAIDFYEGLGGKLMKEWRVFRLDSEGIERLAKESRESGY